MAVASKAEVEVTLGGEAMTLALIIDDIERLEANLGIGLGKLFEHLMDDYRFSEIRAIYQLALERSGKKKTAAQVREMMKVETMTAHSQQCLRLISAALEPLPGKSPPDGEKNSTASPSGDS